MPKQGGINKPAEESCLSAGFMLWDIQVILMDLPKRKTMRLKDFDYSSNCAYFITLCTSDRRCVLGKVIGENDVCPSNIQLSVYGQIVDAAIQKIPQYYSDVAVDKYVIMPNHIHMILMIKNNGRTMFAPTKFAVCIQSRPVILFHDKIYRLSIWRDCCQYTARSQDNRFHCE